MVHNGIEYGDMQLICEAYHILKNVLGLTNDELHNVFSEWNKGDLDSYLIEITRDILAKKDETNPSTYVVDHIRDSAGQKGTGKWTVVSALDFGVPLTLISEAVFARCLSALKDERVKVIVVCKHIIDKRTNYIIFCLMLGINNLTRTICFIQGRSSIFH